MILQLREIPNEIVFLRRLQTEKKDETFCKLLVSKDGSPAVRIDEEIKTSTFMNGNEKLLKRFIELFIIIRLTLLENNDVHHVITYFVGIHRKGL